jgi:hypothetical protein
MIKKEKIIGRVLRVRTTRINWLIENIGVLDNGVKNIIIFNYELLHS